MRGSPANQFICLILLLVLIPATVWGATVTRTLSTAEPGAGEVFEVSLSIEGITLGGVVETLPAGYSIVGTDHPDDRILVRDRQVAFALVNDTLITYQVMAPSSGSGDITGIWEDFLGESNGTIPASHLAVDGIETEVESTPQERPTQEAAPPFAVLAAVVALIIARWGGQR
ncbi:hypothetical protein [Methanoculleus sp.]|jgi:hypothetical protein|uniref:hypothetical protein n=1 Tax=Methanoculleus sp. TaxID=90427 RepID=UPI0026226833|nr:hypothetical protein [Methanoculleus sp.]MDI6867563.1 hypothetical protein [Methanoculleus sp.]